MTNPTVQKVDNTPPASDPPIVAATARESRRISDPEKMARIRDRYRDFTASNAVKLKGGGFVPVASAFVDEMGWLIAEIDRLTAQ